MDAGETNKRQRYDLYSQHSFLYLPTDGKSIALPPISPLDAESRTNVQHRRAHNGCNQGSSMNPLNSSAGSNGQSSAVLSSPGDRLPQTNTTSIPAISAQTIAAGSALASLSGVLSPSDTHRSSDSIAEMRHQSKQSLPSIHEALRADLPRSCPEPMRSSQPTALYQPSLSEANRRQPNPEQYPSSRTYYEGSASHPIPSPRLNGSGQTFAVPALPPPPPPLISRPQPEASSRPYSPNAQSGKTSTLHAFSTDQSPVTAVPPPLPPPPPPPQSLSYSSSRPQSSFDPSGIPQCSPQTPHRQHPYPHPPQFGNLTPASPTTASLTFPPHPAPPPPIHQSFAPPSGSTAGGLGQTHWRSEQQEGNKAQETKRNGRISEVAYGESVKRHLDLFDLEASLNEVCFFLNLLNVR